MPRRSQQKATVLKQNLPALSLLADGTYGYVLRHRIISEDGAKFSDWSNPTLLTFNVNLETLVDLDFVINDLSISLIWDNAPNVSAYDIFTSWDGGDYVYHGTSPIHTYSIINPGGYSTLEVIIQAASVNQVIDTTESIKVAETSAPINVSTGS